MASKVQMMLVIIVALAAATSFLIAPYFGWTLSLVALIVTAVGLFFTVSGIFGVWKNYNPIRSRAATFGVGIVALLIGIGTIAIPGISGTGGPSPSMIGAPSASVGQPAITTTTAQVAGTTPSACSASVDSTLRGKAATLTLDAYNVETDNPYSTAVDSGTAFVFKANTLAEGDDTNLISSGTDTTAGSITNVQVGDVVSIGGGNASYYLDTLSGVCVNGERPNIKLKSHELPVETSLASTVYDDSGSTELGGNTNVDYNQSYGASQERTIFWKIQNNVANRGYKVGGFATTTLTNITEFKPGGNDASLFTQAPTPLYMKDIAVGANSSALNTITRSYTPYVLKTPVLLHEFEFRKYQFTVKASSNDPLLTDGLATMAGIAGVVFDVQTVRGSDGRIYENSIHDRTSSEANVGLSETFTSPVGKQSGFLLAAT